MAAVRQARVGVQQIQQSQVVAEPDKSFLHDVNEQSNGTLQSFGNF